jgi:hypothetical protein
VGIFTSKPDPQIADLAEQIAGLRAEIKVLTTQRDRTVKVRELEDRIEVLKREKATLEEASARRVRETEHKVGLALEKQEHDLANTKRETELAVREDHQAKQQELFAQQMTFQTDRMSAEIERMERMQTTLMEHLPSIEAMFTSKAGEARPMSTRQRENERRAREED